MKNYITFIEDIVEELYHPCWSAFVELIPADDLSELSIEYWNFLSEEEKDYWLSNEDFRTGLTNLKEFFIDEMMSDIERQYYVHEYEVLYSGREVANY